MSACDLQSVKLVKNENIMLQTLGFDIAIEHPHTFVVKCCQLVRGKHITGWSYFSMTCCLVGFSLFRSSDWILEMSDLPGMRWWYHWYESSSHSCHEFSNMNHDWLLTGWMNQWFDSDHFFHGHSMTIDRDCSQQRLGSNILLHGHEFSPSDKHVPFV